MNKKSSHVLTVPARRRPRRSQLPTLLVTGALTLLFLCMSYTCLTFGAETSGGSTGGQDLLYDITATGLTDPTAADTTATVVDHTVAPVDDLYYFRSQLSAEDQDVYDQILTCLQNHDDAVSLPGVSVDKLNALYICVSADHPELFWLGNSYSHAPYADGTTFCPDYNRTIAEVQTTQPLLDDAIQTAQSAIGQPASEYETVKAVYEYIVRTVDYAHSDDDQNVISSLVDHVSVCAGYARGMQLLLQQYGIQAIYVTGNIIDSDGHAWLVVRVDGDYYNVDVTFADRNGENDVVPDIVACDYLYLCDSDDLFYRDRIQDPSYVPVPSCTRDELEYYRMNGRYFTSYDDAVASMEQSLRSGETTWDGQFATQELYDQFKSAIDNGLYSNYAVQSGVSGTFWNMKDDDTETITCYYTTT